MASRRYTSQFSYSFEKQAVRAMLKVVCGSQTGSGTYTITQGLGQGITLARTGTGALTLTLPNKYAALVGVNVTIGRSSGIADLTAQVVADSVSTAKTVTLRMITLAGVAADLASGDVLWITLDLRNN